MAEQKDEREYVEIGEHKFYLPVRPPKKEILFYKEKKKDQYWDRAKVIADIPDFFFAWSPEVLEDAEYTIWEGKKLKSLSVEDTATLIEFRDREIRRMIDGVWFFNNGDPTYITGTHYFALTWGAMMDSLNDVEQGSIYGKYMQFQRNYCYFIEICKTTPLAWGGNVIKPKKTGITMLQSLVILCDAITTRRAYHRIMSTKEDVAKKINFKYISYAIEHLPACLTPEHRKNLGAVFFENTDTASKRGGKKTDQQFMDSAIETVSTVVNGFDSGKNRTAWVDEESKIREGTYPKSLHNTTLPTVMQGLIRVGYVIYTHYVSEKNDRSFREAKVIYFESKMKTIQEATGMTKSRLLCYPMTVLDGIFGACDRYGQPDLQRIWKEINAQHEALKDDPEALRSYRRQMPTCEADMWQEGAGEASIFDNIRLSEKLHDLMEERSVGNVPYMDFNFRWTMAPQIDEIKGLYQYNGIPQVVPVTMDEKRANKKEGLFRWYRPELTPKKFLDEFVTKIELDKRGRMKPKDNTPFFMSIDPTQYSQGKDVVTASKNCLHVFLLPNAEVDGIFNKKVTYKRLMVQYLYRPDSPKETLMHVVQSILYFGCYVLIENNASWLRTRLKEWGFANFIIEMNKDTQILEPYKEFTDQKPFTSQKNVSNDTITEYLSAGMNHLVSDGMIDNIEMLDSEEVIEQLIEFDPEDTRRFDAAVCYLIGLLGVNSYLGWRERDSSKRSRRLDGSLSTAARGLMR